MLHSLAWVCQLWRPAKLLSPQFVFLSIGVDISVHVRRRKFWFPGLQHCHVVSHNQDTQPLPEVAWDLQVIYFLRNGLRDIKSNCMPKIRVIGWFWNLALFWQLISCHELSNCHKKVLTPEIDWGIWNLTVCQKSLWLVEFEILPYFDSLSVVTCCQVVIKKFWLKKMIWG